MIYNYNCSSIVNASIHLANSQRKHGRRCNLRFQFQDTVLLQSTLGFATMGIAANLDIAATTSLTDLCHYIIATLGITTFHFVPYVAK